MLKSQQGMTLVEVLIALLILSVGLLGLAPVLFHSATQIRVHQDQRAAYQVLFDAIEELNQLPFADLKDDFADTTVERDGVGVLLSIDVDRGDDDKTWEPGEKDIDINLAICTLAIEWKDLRGQVRHATSGLIRIRP